MLLCNPYSNFVIELLVTRNKHMKHLYGAFQGRLLHR